MVVAVAALAGAQGIASPGPSSAEGPISNPHGGYTVTTDSCSSCHRSHTAEGGGLLNVSTSPQSALCFACHDGTGASSNVAGEYADLNVPADDPATSSFYSHPATTASTHTSGQTDEFAGVLNRHTECSDCHNPHQSATGAPTETAGGWTASESLAGTPGVTGSLTWVNPLAYEYELCLKCHSGYTQLLSYTKESYKKTDKAAEFDPAGASYHPVQAAGKNTTAAMTNSLAGGSLWQFTTASTVRCLNCHGNYRLVGDPPTPNSPAPQARLAPHSSPYRGLLIANYRDRDLKIANEPYDTNDFALCYLCHSEAPFQDQSGDSRTDTNFRFHGLHLGAIGNAGSGGVDIDTAGAGQGNAVCAECHYRSHGTALAPWSENQSYERGVNFAPNVEPVAGPSAPLWSLANANCTLVCHGKDHNPKGY
jgi:predicted CXXCH cytochrome family protein